MSPEELEHAAELRWKGLGIGQARLSLRSKFNREFTPGEVQHAFARQCAKERGVP